MKKPVHLFMIHSSITALMTRFIIKYENLKPEDVFIITRKNVYELVCDLAPARHFLISENLYQDLAIGVYHRGLDCGEEALLMEAYNAMLYAFLDPEGYKLQAPSYSLPTPHVFRKLADRFAKDHGDISKDGPEYIAYIAHLLDYNFINLARNPKCVGVNFFEEGGLNFSTIHQYLHPDIEEERNEIYNTYPWCTKLNLGVSRYRTELGWRLQEIDNPNFNPSLYEDESSNTDSEEAQVSTDLYCNCNKQDQETQPLQLNYLKHLDYQLSTPEVTPDLEKQALRQLKKLPLQTTFYRLNKAAFGYVLGERTGVYEEYGYELDYDVRVVDLKVDFDFGKNGSQGIQATQTQQTQQPTQSNQTQQAQQANQPQQTQQPQQTHQPTPQANTKSPELELNTELNTELSKSSLAFENGMILHKFQQDFYQSPAVQNQPRLRQLLANPEFIGHKVNILVVEQFSFYLSADNVLEVMLNCLSGLVEKGLFFGFVKFHPKTNEIDKQVFREWFAKCRIILKEIDPAMSLELEFLNAQPYSIVVHTVQSSLGIYASSFNQHVFEYNKYCKDLPEYQHLYRNYKLDEFIEKNHYPHKNIQIRECSLG